MEQVNVAIADDNERILDLLEEIINMDKELHVVGLSLIHISEPTRP